MGATTLNFEKKKGCFASSSSRGFVFENFEENIVI